MKILVTGGNGMLAKALRNSRQSGEFDLTFCTRAELDITNAAILTEYIGKHSFDAIINCAAYTNVEGAEVDIDAAYAINKTGSRNLAIAARSVNAILIHISTDAVYDGRKSGVYTENDSCNPLSVYSKSKYEGEREVLSNHDMGVIIRTSWLYSIDKGNFVTTIINKARATGNINVVFDQLGTPTYAYDLANAILHILRSGKIISKSGIGIYHYSNEGVTSWYDFAASICRILDINAIVNPVTSDKYPSKVMRPFHAIMSKEKIKADFDLVIPHWRSSLELCLSLYRK